MRKFEFRTNTRTVGACGGKVSGTDGTNKGEFSFEIWCSLDADDAGVMISSRAYCWQAPVPSTRTSSSPGSSHVREPRGKLQDRGSSLPQAPQAPIRRRHIRHRAFLRRDGQLSAPPRGGDLLQPPGLARRGQPHPKGTDRLRGATGNHLRDQVHAASNESDALLVRGAHHAALRVRVVVLGAHIAKSITALFFFSCRHRR